ncbi:hypothetical protein Ac2012v2_004752 [Leucoagaricus gongylophorus]
MLASQEPSEESLKTFVDHLVDSVIGGELYLTDFSTEKGAKIQASAKNDSLASGVIDKLL